MDCADIFVGDNHRIALEPGARVAHGLAIKGAQEIVVDAVPNLAADLDGACPCAATGCPDPPDDRSRNPGPPASPVSTRSRFTCHSGISRACYLCESVQSRSEPLPL